MEESRILYYIDKLIPLLPSYSKFNVSEQILNSNWKVLEKQVANDNSEQITNIMEKHLRFIEGEYWYALTDEGRTAKEFGDSVAFKARQKEILDRKEKKEALDLKNAERVYKSYHSTRIFAWIGMISGLAALLFKLAEVFKLFK